MSSMLNVKTLGRALLLGLLLTAAPAAAQQPASPPAQAPPAPTQTTPPRTAPPRPSQDEFVPVSDLPDSEKLPAAPFLIAAYTIVWLVLLAYVWSLWRRLSNVEQELQRAVQAAGRRE
jgi:CcmD family protein